MATFVIGDLQGCFTSLHRLLEEMKFDPAFDRVWFAGDLVSRGRHSLQTLRYAKSLGKACISVLGNHDISLVAAAYGVFAPHNSLKPLFDAPDFAELLHWLQQQPLLHHDPQLNAVIVHAGIPPVWNLSTAKACAQEAENCLRQQNPAEWLAAIYGNQPDHWNPRTHQNPIDRQRYIVNAFTRMRYCRPDGSLEFKQKLDPDSVKSGHPDLIPWFKHPHRKPVAETVYFGHWSTLGYYQGHNVVALDTGCVWGGQITGVRIDSEKKRKFQVPCTEYGR
ncbi:MAG: symmetrical bis(5'-nucleosyl)-tetraphosphatase [Thiolinea sp.]